jgi:hypothetical protein
MADDLAELDSFDSSQEFNSPLEQKNPLLDGLKERFKNVTTGEAITNLDIMGRLRTLASDPQTYNLMIKGLEIGVFVGGLTGLFGDALSQQAITTAVTASKALGGMAEGITNVPANAKVGIEAINFLTGSSIAGDITKAIEVAGDFNIGDRVQNAKELFMGIKDRLNLELADFGANSRDILSAMNSFGVAPAT